MAVGVFAIPHTAVANGQGGPVDPATGPRPPGVPPRGPVIVTFLSFPP
jgi:hypothetical protein